MLNFKRIYPTMEQWGDMLEQYPDRTLFQSGAWLRFLESTQHGELVFAVLQEGNSILGLFVGIIIRRLGVRILGSPFPGWTTSYMGFVLRPEVSRLDALNALRVFAFRDLKCLHLELMDRRIDARTLGDSYGVRIYHGFEIDLRTDEEQLFTNMAPPCRRCIRKAMRCGIAVEEASDAEFVRDYYTQLEYVFAKQALTPTYGIDRVSAMVRHLHSRGNLLLLRAFDADRHCIATGIFPASHDRAYFWGGASWRTFQHLRPNEILMWYAIRYWKKRGIQFFDMGGAGEYKRKYGGYEISVPWLRVSRHPILSVLRGGAMAIVKSRQRWSHSWQSISASASGA